MGGGGYAAPSMEAAEARDGAQAQEAARAGWRVRLLGAVDAEPIGDPDAAARRIVRWPTRAVAALLAQLALAPHRSHAREELVELLWPGVAPDIGRNRLRQTLSTLKGLLERDGDPPVLLTDRIAIRVRPGALACDAVDFERHVRRGDAAAARAAYQGALMPGHYDDWVIAERERLAGLHDRLAAEPIPPARPLLGTGHAPADWVPSQAPRGLPSYLTRAFGLEDIATRLQARAQVERLVTVHGPGGSGKTRLAARTAAALGSAPDAPFEVVVFVPLLACTTAEQTLEAVATALGATAGADAAARVHAALSGRAALLVLDNAEQLDPQADAALTELLTALPRLHLMLTSRRLLGVDGERAFELHGLPQPPAAAAPAEAADSPAVALFVDRARAVVDGFALESSNREAVAGIVRLLSGMPLAIELAASRLRSLSPAELLEHLSGRRSAALDLLARNAPPASGAQARHASMRHVVGWSWTLLTPAQRGVMQALSTFGVPAPLGVIAAAAGLGEAEVLRHLAALHDLSLVRRTTDARHATRWAQLQPVREFAIEQQPPAEARAARGRVRRWLIEQVPPGADPDATGATDDGALVHAAIAGGIADGEGRESLQLALARRPHWDHADIPPFMLPSLEQALSAAEIPAALRSDGHEFLSCAQGNAGHSSEAVRQAQLAIETAPDPRRRSLALARWAWAAYFAGRYDADFETLLDEAEHCAEASDAPGALAIVLRVRTLIACNLRLDFAQAETLAARAQVLFERIGQRDMARVSRVNLLLLRAGRGQIEEMLAGFHDVLSEMREAGDASGLMHTTRQHGRVLTGLRRFAEAVEAFRTSLRIAAEQELMQGIAHGLLHLPEALLHGSDADTEAAARLQGYAVLHWERLFPRLNRIEAREVKRARRMLRRRLGGARAEALMLAGRALSQSAALRLALTSGGPA